MCLRLQFGNFPTAPSTYMLYLKDYTNTCCYVALYVSTMLPTYGPIYQLRRVFFFSINFVWKITSFSFVPDVKKEAVRLLATLFLKKHLFRKLKFSL